MDTNHAEQKLGGKAEAMPHFGSQAARTFNSRINFIVAPRNP